MSPAASDAATPPHGDRSLERFPLVRKLMPALCWLILMSVTFAVYARCLTADFVYWDDDVHIYANAHLLQPLSVSLPYFWHHPYENLYVPLSYTLFALLANAARLAAPNPALTDTGALLDPHVFHVASLMLHLINASLVFLLLRVLTRVDLPALIGALLFSAHPLQVESVAWISETRGLLSGCFSLTAILLYVLATRSGSRPAMAALYGAALIASLAALLSKPSAVSLPLILFAIDRWVLNRPWRTCAISSAPWVLLCVPFVLVTRQAQPIPAAIVAPFWGRPFILGDALAFYCGKFVLPIRLGIDYGRKPSIALSVWWTYATWLIPAALAFFVYRFRNQSPWLVGASLMSLGALLPVLGLVPFIFQGYSTVADRYCYLALLGPALAVAFWLKDAPLRDARTMFCALALAALCGASFVQAGVWKNTLTLMTQALTVNPRCWLADNNLGYTISTQPRTPEVDDAYQAALAARARVGGKPSASLSETTDPDQRAIALYQTCLALNPAFATAHYDWGLALLDEHQAAAAIVQVRSAIAAQPHYPEAHATLGNLLLDQGHAPDAITEYQTALMQNPSLSEAHYGLGNALAQTGKPAQAQAEYRTAIALNPRDVLPHVNLANLLMQQGQVYDAMAEYQAALQLNPNLELARYNLGLAQLQQGQYSAAADEFTAALRLDPNSADTHDELGTALGMEGDPASAAAQFREALRLDPSSAAAKAHLQMAENQLKARGP